MRCEHTNTLMIFFKMNMYNDLMMSSIFFKVKAFMVRPVGLPTSSSSISLPPSEAKKRRGNTVDALFNMGAREELNAIIARIFYYGGLLFNFARNPYYAMALTYAANSSISGYISPGYNSLRTTLLQNEKSNIEEVGTHQEHVEFEGCVFVVMDGRTHKAGRSLISWSSRKVSLCFFLP